MTVRCDTMEQWMEVITNSVMKGLLFIANGEDLTVEYTGGF